MRKVKWAVVVPCVVAALAAVGVLVYAYLQSTHLSEQSDANQTKIEELTKQLDALRDVDTIPAETITAEVHNASEAGKAVAKLQSHSSGKALDEATLKKNAEAINHYFEDGLDAGAIWLPTNRAHTWVFKTDYDVAQTVFQTMFLCYADADDTSTLLAYAVADYDAEKDLFVSLEKHVLLCGDAYCAGGEAGKTADTKNASTKSDTKPSSGDNGEVSHSNGSGNNAEQALDYTARPAPKEPTD